MIFRLLVVSHNQMQQINMKKYASPALLQILLIFAGGGFGYHKAENYRHFVKDSVDVFGKIGMLGV